MAKEFQTVKNKKAYFDYEILESFEAGIILTGEEIKSVRSGGLNLSGSYVIFKRNTLFLVGASIARYRFSSNQDYDSRRDRKLLLKMPEIERIHLKLQTKGISLIPLEAYFKNHFLKLKIGLGKGKKQYDKRETIKKRELDREMKKMGKR